VQDNGNQGEQEVTTSPRLAFGKVRDTTLGAADYYRFLPGYKDAVTTGTELYHDLSGLAYAPDPPIPTLQQLTMHPDSRSALIISSMFMVAENEKMVKEQLKISKAIENCANYSIDSKNNEYLQCIDEATGAYCAKRAPLIDFNIRDPENNSHLPHFRMITHHCDPQTGFNAYAFYNEESKSVIFAYPGLDLKDKMDMKSLRDTFHNQQNPQMNFVPEFMEHTVQEIIRQGLPVEKTVINAHSLGAGSGLAATAWCIKHPDKMQTLGADIPKLVLLEGWDETREAKRVASTFDLPIDKLKQQAISVRNYPGTLVNVDNNPPFGSKINAIMAPTLDVSAFAPINRNMAHKAMIMAGDMLADKAGVVENFKGEFKPMHFITKTGYPILTAPGGIWGFMAQCIANEVEKIKNYFMGNSPQPVHSFQSQVHHAAGWSRY